MAAVTCEHVFSFIFSLTISLVSSPTTRDANQPDRNYRIRYTQDRITVRLRLTLPSSPPLPQTHISLLRSGLWYVVCGVQQQQAPLIQGLQG